MDIFNRPPSISDDTVIYRLYPPQEIVQERAGVSSISTLIQSYIEGSLLPSNHIWHRDAFVLKVVDDEDVSNKRWVLEGTMRVGDCVDDEWCVVWLLSDISRKWDMAISIYDSDGEFLLIEAAEHLPSWVTPTNAENRVWIYQSQFHLIPIDHVSPKGRPPGSNRRKLPNQEDDEDDLHDPEEHDSYISVEDALRVLRDPTITTTAHPPVQEAVFAKIKGYPGVFSQHLHTTKAYLPADIVLALHQNPSLVQKAVEAFYTRDALQLRAAARMTRFSPTTSILAPVTMTRTAYAQLAGQRFHPPRIFGVWKEQEGTKEWRHKDIGMKIACGFEMMYSESRSNAGPSGVSDNSEESVNALKDGLQRNPLYLRYIQCLTEAGFFPQGELTGSGTWKERESKAALYWIESRKDDTANRPSFTSLVDQAISTIKSQKEMILTQDISKVTEDSEDWLNVSPDDLELKLAQAYGPKGASKMEVDEPQAQSEDAIANQRAEKLEKLAKKVERFVNEDGDLEGARFDDDLLSDDEDIKLSDPEDSEDEELDEDMRQKAIDELIPPLDPSEYGKISSASDNPYDKADRSTSPPPTTSKSQKATPTTLENERRTLPNGETRRIRKPILMRNRFDGVDSDDESSEEEEDDAAKAVNASREEDESDDEQPQVVGGVNIDMDINMEDEEQDFLKFTREALGISDKMWNDIIQEREARGAFVPTSSKPSRPPQDEEQELKKKENTERFFDEIPIPTPRGPRENRPPPPPDAVRNPDLNSFETVMQALDDELARAKAARNVGKSSSDVKKSSKVTPAGSNGKGKEKATTEETSDDEQGIDADMDAELRQALRRDDEDDENDDEEVAEAGMDYNLIKNFLESFRNQQGMAGPVSNLAGRLMPGFNLPRDDI